MESSKSQRYLNREYSWLQFNHRVLLEAQSPENPLLERIKYLAIFESNLDEFYMVRVSGLIEQKDSGVTGLTPDGLTPSEQLDWISKLVAPMRKEAAKIWSNELKPALEDAGIKFVKFSDLNSREKQHLTEVFHQSIFPLCTPLMVYPAITFPFMSNRSLNLAVVLQDESGEKLARVKVPPVVNRAMPVPGKGNRFILLEDLISAHLDMLFPGVKIVDSFLFRVVRDADIEIRELEAADLISAVEQSLRLRRFGDAVLLEVDKKLPSVWRSHLREGLELIDAGDVLSINGQIGMEFLWEIAGLDIPELKFPRHQPYVSDHLIESDQIFGEIKKNDVLVHHPFDSFDSVSTFVGSAASDPDVVGIKQTLYRVGSQSPVVESLLSAAEKGKQVAVMVELKARFDENNNLIWSRALERAGVHVTYGMMEMKVHCKLSLIVRREGDSVSTYAHIGTGNYNPSTAKLYTDLGLFTKDQDVCQDITELFNYLTGFSKQKTYRKLLVAPLNVREGILKKIHEEIEFKKKTGVGKIQFKLNSLVDPEVIDALYLASQAGVEVDLVVRGICCLRPGVEGMSETIRVRSIVGRFLEHSRIYAFEHGGNPIAYIGSADMMRRNLDRRIEVLIPITDAKQVKYLCEDVIGLCLKDNVKAWDCQSDGSYSKSKQKKNQKKLSSQDELINHPAGKLLSN